MKNTTKLILGLSIALILSICGHVISWRIRDNEKTSELLSAGEAKMLILQKQAEIVQRDSAIATIRRERTLDSIKSTIDSRAFKSKIRGLEVKLSKLPKTVPYNPDSATVDSLRVAFVLKDSVIDTQKLRIVELETEKEGVVASLNREISKLNDQRADQVTISNTLQEQIVKEQANTRKEVRKKKFFRTLSVIGAAGIGILLLKP